MKVLYFLFAFIVFVNTAFSQMTVNTGGTPMDYALELVGPGITISNVTFTGANAQIGTFDGSTSNVGFDGGVVISAGPVTGLIGGARSSRCWSARRKWIGRQ